MPLQEDMLANPKSPYGLQKYIGELYCRLFSEIYGLSTVTLRYFNVYGPGASAEGAYALVIAKFLQQRLDGVPLSITGDGTQTRDFTHVDDVVRSNLLAARSPRVGQGEVINIGIQNQRNHILFVGASLTALLALAFDWAVATLGWLTTARHEA